MFVSEPLWILYIIYLLLCVKRILKRYVGFLFVFLSLFYLCERKNPGHLILYGVSHTFVLFRKIKSLTFHFVKWTDKFFSFFLCLFIRLKHLTWTVNVIKI